MIETAAARHAPIGTGTRVMRLVPAPPVTDPCTTPGSPGGAPLTITEATVASGDVATSRPRRHLAVVRTGEALRRAQADEDGMTTAEYAVGTLAACAFGAVLLKVVTSDGVAKLLADLIKRALSVTL